MKRAVAAILLIALSATVAMARVKVEVQRDKKFDFATLKTWAWNPSGPGDVKVWLTAESKSEPVKKTYEPVTYKGGGHGFMRAGEMNPKDEGNAKAREEAWKRWTELLKKLR